MEAILTISQPIARNEATAFGLVDLIQFFAENADADSYAIIVDSVGGDVNEGFRIADYIEDYEKPVRTIARRVYSIANVIYAAGHTREAEAGAEFMLHKAMPPELRWLNADELREVASELDRIDEKIVGYISARTGASIKDVRAIMQDDTFVTADQATSIGLIGTSPAPIRAAARFLPKNESRSDYPKAASENAKRALKWIEENGNPNDCLTDVGFARANQLANREPISDETIRRMAQFRRHQQNKNVSYEEGCGGIAWDAWGGDAGIEWAERITAQQQEANKMTLKEQLNALLIKAGFKAEAIEAANITLSLENGDEVYIESENGDLVGKPTAAPVGRHNLADGRVLVVAPGEGDMNVVEAVEDAPADMDEPKEDDNAMDMEEYKKRNAELEAKLAAMEEELTAMRKSNEAQNSKLSEAEKELKEAKLVVVNAMKLIETEAKPPAKTELSSRSDQNPEGYNANVARKYENTAAKLMREISERKAAK